MVPDDPSPPTAGVETIPGSYAHPAYRDLNLIQTDPNEAGSITAAIATLTSHMPLDLTSPVFLWCPAQPWGSYFLFTHLNGNRFSWTEVIAVHEKENGYVAGHGAGEKAVTTRKGVGMFGNFWGAGSEVPSVAIPEDEAKVEEKAEVWFRRHMRLGNDLSLEVECTACQKQGGLWRAYSPLRTRGQSRRKLGGKQEQYFIRVPSVTLHPDLRDGDHQRSSPWWHLVLLDLTRGVFQSDRDRVRLRLSSLSIAPDRTARYPRCPRLHRSGFCSCSKVSLLIVQLTCYEGISDDSSRSRYTHRVVTCLHTPVRYLAC